MTDLWVSSNKGTCLVVINEDKIIVDSAPLWKKFRGQPLQNLLDWLGRGTNVVKL